jgi:hypothetical protein
MKNHKKTLVLVIAVLALISIMLPPHIQNQSASASQEGTMTSKQKEHSKLYKEYKTGKKLRDLAEQVGDVKLKRNVGAQGGDSGQLPLDLQTILQRAAQAADAVIIGTAKGSSSQLTEDEDYIFTDYEIAVEEVLKNNAAHPIASEEAITVTRPGGTIRLNGRKVEAEDASFLPYAKGGRYLIFLTYLPQTNSYKALDSRSSFELYGKEVIKLTKESFSLNNEDAASFLNKVRVATGNSGNEGGK